MSPLVVYVVLLGGLFPTPTVHISGIQRGVNDPAGDLGTRSTTSRGDADPAGGATNLPFTVPVQVDQENEAIWAIPLLPVIYLG